MLLSACSGVDYDTCMESIVECSPEEGIEVRTKHNRASNTQGFINMCMSLNCSDICIRIYMNIYM